MYEDTVTVFNRQRGRDGDVWYPTVLHGVNLNIDKGAILKQYGPESQDNAVLNVRTDIIDGYVPPKEWQSLESKDGTFTFAPNDFIWKGEWTGGSPISDDNYGDLSFYDYMLAYYDFVYNVTTVGYFSVIPHIEVGAR